MKPHRGTIIREGAVMALGDLAAKRQPIAVANGWTTRTSTYAYRPRRRSCMTAFTRVVTVAEHVGASLVRPLARHHAASSRWSRRAPAGDIDREVVDAASAVLVPAVKHLVSHPFT